MSRMLRAVLRRKLPSAVVGPSRITPPPPGWASPSTRRRFLRRSFLCRSCSSHFFLWEHRHTSSSSCIAHTHTHTHTHTHKHTHTHTTLDPHPPEKNRETHRPPTHTQVHTYTIARAHTSTPS